MNFKIKIGKRSSTKIPAILLLSFIYFLIIGMNPVKHPEGLTFTQIAKLVGMHRHTVTKYVYQLIGSGEIYQREVGTARLCYLRKNYSGDSEVVK